ncbi:MAG: hypothetical protein IJV31_10230 [Clostridia bacterium]|nr:hypothetical protein [Clostridia bacterium]
MKFRNEKDENNIKTLYYLGKLKLVNYVDKPGFTQYIGKEKNVKSIDNTICFIDESGNIYKILLEEIKLLEETELKINKFYEVKFKNKGYEINKTDLNFDTNIINECINKEDVKNTMIFDEKIIEKEIEIVKKYAKIKSLLYWCMYSTAILMMIILRLVTEAMTTEDFISIFKATFSQFSIIIIAILSFYIATSCIITLLFMNKIKEIED